MRILIVSNFLPPRMLGGFELACYNIAKGLRSRGHEVLVLTSPTEKQPAEPQPFVERVLSVRWLSLERPPDPFLVRALRHETQVSQASNTQIVIDRIRAFRPDVVMYFNLVGLGGLAIVNAVDDLGVPWTMNLGDRFPTDLRATIADDILDVFSAGPGGDLFARGRSAAVSQTLVDEVQNSGVALGEVTIIPRGVTVADVHRTREYREGGVTRFVSAGALQPHKGIDLIIDAASALVRDGHDAFTVDLYGWGERERYERMVADRNLGGHVTFRGPVGQAEVIAANAASDSFLFPTWEREPGASVPIEAGVAGATTIMTASCGPAERMVDGVHCIKIERTVDSLAEAMRSVIDGEVDLAAIGEQARRLAAGDLSFATSIDRVESFLAAAQASRGTDRVDDRAVDVAAVERHDAAQRLLYAQMERTARDHG